MVLVSTCINFTITPFNCFWHIRSVCLCPEWIHHVLASWLLQESPYTHAVVSPYRVEFVWSVGRSMLPSVPMSPSCFLKCTADALPAPPPHPPSHQTSPHALCSLGVCALNPSPPPALPFIGASSALVLIFLPWPTSLLHFLLPSTLSFSISVLVQ